MKAVLTENILMAKLELYRIAIQFFFANVFGVKVVCLHFKTSYVEVSWFKCKLFLFSIRSKTLRSVTLILRYEKLQNYFLA